MILKKDELMLEGQSTLPPSLPPSHPPSLPPSLPPSHQVTCSPVSMVGGEMVCTARLPVREPPPQTHPGRRERGPPGREGEKEEGGEGGREGDHQLYPHPLHLYFSLGSLPSPLSPSSPITSSLASSTSLPLPHLQVLAG